jgi:putative transposase
VAVLNSTTTRLSPVETHTPRPWTQPHLLHALREFESFYNEHRPHRTLGQAAPLRALPVPIADLDQITNLNIRRRDRLSGVLREYRYAA